jgi:hypothetical protein
VKTVVSTGKEKEVAAMRKAIHAQADAQAAQERVRHVVEKLKAMKLAKTAEIVATTVEETVSHPDVSIEGRQVRGGPVRNPISGLAYTRFQSERSIHSGSPTSRT